MKVWFEEDTTLYLDLEPSVLEVSKIGNLNLMKNRQKIDNKNENNKSKVSINS